MITKLKLLFSKPGIYIPIAIKTLLSLPQRLMCRPFSRLPFFLQSQMDLSKSSIWHNKEFISKTGGFYLPDDTVDRKIINIEPWDIVRRDMLILLLRSLNANGIKGDIAEVGVYRGHTAKLIHQYMPDRMLHLFDTFTGFDKRSIELEMKETQLEETSTHYSDTSLKRAMRHIKAVNENVSVHKGRFPDTITDDLQDKKFSFVHLDADLYDPIKEGLKFFYDKITPGGIIVIHDYNSWPGPRKAVDEFFIDKKEIPVPMPDKNGSALIIKS